jgi:predicted kinase
MKILMLKGLPASGKSTFAKKLVSDSNGQWKRVNKDDLRAMLDNSKHSKDREKFILKIRDLIIEEAIENGKNVVIDDTNLAPFHENRLKQLAEKHKVDFEVDDTFLSVSLDECIERDLKRDNPVGKKVITKMYYSYVYKENFYESEVNENCIIVDIDGTVAKMNGRSPFDWDRVDEDLPKMNIINLVKSYVFSSHCTLVFMSGRDEVSRTKTISWLDKYFTFPYKLYMRKEGDNRSDVIVKKELFYDNVHDKLNPLFVIDDRRQVVDLWRSLGLTCLEVADHRF